MSLRAPRDGDFAAMLELMNAHQFAAYGEADVTPDELQTWLTTPTVDPQRDIRLFERDGRLLGYADADEVGVGPRRWWSDVKIAPDADAAEIFPQLLVWLEERAGEGLLRVWTGADDARMLRVYGDNGFREARHSYRMEIALGAGTHEPAWPEGLALRRFEPADERNVYDVNVEVWKDTSDPLEESFEEWQHWNTKRASFDPSLWFLVFDREELAGFSLCREDDTDANAGYVGVLGVRRPWRQRGLGEALLLHSFGAFVERGYTRATLGVDASSPTGATRLYERVGMTVYRDTVFFDRPVRPTRPD
jgi:ribosomal protein S18 acetylase RimI-like enzyme